MGLNNLYTIHDFELAARKIMKKEHYDYCAGGAGTESTLINNTEVFNNYLLKPKSLIDVSEISMKTNLYGFNMRYPFTISSMGLQHLANAEGEIGTSIAAKENNIGFGLSTFSTKSMEEVANVNDTGFKFFQLYILKDKSIVENLIRRAELANYNAIVITVDVPIVGIRLRDRRNKFSRFENSSISLLQDKVFLKSLTTNDTIENKLKKLDEIFPNPAVTWEDIKWVQEITDLPIILKGIMNLEDAEKAYSLGISGIVISNHGGRQLDHSISSLEALNEIAPKMKGKLNVFFDSGIRNGTHIYIALALGADCVFIGRPVLWGLAVSGVDGVNKIIEILASELLHAMKITGTKTVKEIQRDNIIRRRN